jgi:hypothetical protein
MLIKLHFIDVFIQTRRVRFTNEQAQYMQILVGARSVNGPYRGIAIYV